MHTSSSEQSLIIPVEPIQLEGDLTIPDAARGLVLFAHGSGSSRKSPRNRFVARTLVEQGFATLLFDLLTAEEGEQDDADMSFRFDIPLLAERLGKVTDWILAEGSVAHLPVGYFGASTGAAAALVAAADRPDTVRAVVSRGGRPELAEGALARLHAPTLLIVGGADRVILHLNREALDRISGAKHLTVVPEATHLFEEPGALERVAELAAEWFALHLPRPPEPGAPPSTAIEQP